jgi:hypothetical protein
MNEALSVDSSVAELPGAVVSNRFTFSGNRRVSEIEWENYLSSP